MFYKHILILLTFLLAFSACSDDDGASSDPIDQELLALIVEDFTLADFNDDGVLSDDEIQGKIEREFDVEDRDKDGVLTASDHKGPEYLGNTVTAINRGELVFDSNGDEVVSFEEYSDGTNQTFVELMDVDENGELTQVEVLDFWGLS